MAPPDPRPLLPGARHARVSRAARLLATAEAIHADRYRFAADGVIEGAAPIALDAPGGRAALLVHGFGDTPQSLAALAAHLHARGWTVRVPLLPGHGRRITDFAAGRADEWAAAVWEAHGALTARHATVALVGQSMGGALVAALAGALGPRLPALVLLAPYLAAPRVVRWGGRLAPLLGAVAPLLSSDGGERSIHDAAARAAALGPGVVTPRLLRELTRVVDRARDALAAVRAPTLVVQSRLDNRIAPEAAEAAFRRLGAPVRRLEWLTACGHVVSVDREQPRVLALTAAWLARHAPADGRTLAAHADPAAPAASVGAGA